LRFDRTMIYNQVNERPDPAWSAQGRTACDNKHSRVELEQVRSKPPAETPTLEREQGVLSFMIDATRIETMRERLGDASALVESDQYLPLYRNRQINHPELFNFSVKLAKRKTNPARYFASIWSSKNLAKTIDWLQKLINLAQSKAREVAYAAKKVADTVKEAAQLNREGRRRYEKMLKKTLQQAGSRPIRA